MSDRPARQPETDARCCACLAVPDSFRCLNGTYTMCRTDYSEESAVRYVTGVLSAILAAAFLYFTFVSVSASSAPGGEGADPGSVVTATDLCAGASRCADS